MITKIILNTLFKIFQWPHSLCKKTRMLHLFGSYLPNNQLRSRVYATLWDYEWNICSWSWEVNTFVIQSLFSFTHQYHPGLSHHTFSCLDYFNILLLVLPSVLTSLVYTATRGILFKHTTSQYFLPILKSLKAFSLYKLWSPRKPYKISPQATHISCHILFTAYCFLACWLPGCS